MSAEDYERFVEEEKMKQGKAFKKVLRNNYCNNVH